MLRHAFLEDAGFGPEMLIWGEPVEQARERAQVVRFAASPPLSRRGFCEAADGSLISVVPSANRLGLRRAAAEAGSAFEWHLDTGLARRFASLALSLADHHPGAGHHYLDSSAEQEATVRLSLNEYPPHYRAEGAWCRKG